MLRRKQRDPRNVRTLRLEQLEPLALLTCDLNADGQVNSFDIDYFSETTADPALLDLDRNGRVEPKDRASLIEIGLDSVFGDANLDGIFSSADFVAVFQAGEYEDAIAKNSRWSTGDWNADGDFGSGDFVLAFQTGRYEQGPRDSFVEPGNDIRSASNLGSLTAALTIHQAYGIDQSCAADPADFYRFELTTATAVTITMTGRTDGGGIYLFSDRNGNGLFDASAESLQNNIDSSAADRRITKDLTPGVYYVRAGRWSESDASRYTLTIRPE